MNETGEKWSEKEVEFYVAGAGKGWTTHRALLEAHQEGFPSRSGEAVRNKIRHLGKQWSKIRGLDVPLPEVPVNLDQEVIHEKELERLRAELRILSDKYKIAIRGEAFYLRILDLVSTHIKALPPFEYKEKESKIKPQIIEESLILFLSDFHCGEVVKSEQTAGFGNYNSEVFQRRIEEYTDTVIKFTNSILLNYRYRTIHIFLNGDLVSGLIHEELRIGADSTVIQQVLLCTRVLAAMIRDLQATHPKIPIKIHCEPGNHGRTNTRPQHKNQATDSFDYMIFVMLEQMFRNDDFVKFNIPLSPYCLVQIEGFNWLLTHGSWIKSWAGIPFYGIERAVINWVEQFGLKGESFQHIALSHFHRPYELSLSGRRRIFGNGSVMGPNDFSLDVVRGQAEPSQWMLAVHPHNGVTLRVDVYLKEWAKKEKYRYNFPVGDQNGK